MKNIEMTELIEGQLYLITDLKIDRKFTGEFSEVIDRTLIFKMNRFTTLEVNLDTDTFSLKEIKDTRPVEVQIIEAMRAIVLGLSVTKVMTDIMTRKEDQEED